MKKVWLALVSMCMVACGANDSISRDHRCWFVFSYTDHPTSLLFTAVQNPGSYAFVTTSGDGKKTARHVYVQINEEQSVREDNVIRTDLENGASYSLGVNNDIGLIIGCTNFNGSCAYDRSCPNCSIPRALNWTGNRQHVACSKCSRTYALETGAITDGDEGSPLMRYYCSFDGSLLRAWN